MKFIKIILGVLATIVVLGDRPICAQGKPSTLHDFLNAAITNHPLIGSAEQAKASAAFTNESIRKGYYPQFGVASHLIAAPGYDEAVTNGGELGAQIVGSYTLFDGGARTYEIQKGGVGVAQSTLNVVRTRADIVYSVSVAFANAVKEKRELGVAEQGYSQLNDYLQLVKQLHASGQGSEVDVLKTTVDLNNAAVDIQSRETALVNSLLGLAQASGLPSSKVTDVDTSVVTFPYDSTLNDQSNIDLASQELLLKQADLETQIVGAKLQPTIALGADAGALTSLPNLQQGFNNVFGASVGLSFSLPLMTFGSLEDNYNAAKASARSISLQNDYARTSLGHDFQMTRNNIERSKAEIAGLEQNLVIAEQNLLLSRARYAGGTGLSLEVLDAIQMVNQIKMSMEEARSELSVNIFKLNRLNYSGASKE